MRERHPDIDSYFKYRQCLEEAKTYAGKIETSVYLIDHLIEYHFNTTEKYIFEHHLILRRSLKIIANELNYSYGYTRQLLLQSRNKLDHLLLEHEKNNQ